MTVNHVVVGSSPTSDANGSVAQLVEQWSEEPRVGSSILSGSTSDINSDAVDKVTSQSVESSSLFVRAN